MIEIDELGVIVASRLADAEADSDPVSDDIGSKKAVDDADRVVESAAEAGLLDGGGFSDVKTVLLGWMVGSIVDDGVADMKAVEDALGGCGVGGTSVFEADDELDAEGDGACVLVNDVDVDDVLVPTRAGSTKTSLVREQYSLSTNLTCSDVLHT